MRAQCGKILLRRQDLMTFFTKSYTLFRVQTCLIKTKRDVCEADRPVPKKSYG